MIKPNTAEEMDAEVDRLNRAIKDEESRIAGFYPEIGKRYCEICGDAPLPELADSIEAVREGQQKIKAYNKQLGLLRGVVPCEKCGKEVSVHASFCGSCGASMRNVLLELADADDRICPICGLATPRDSLFCEKCGARISDVAKIEDLLTPAAPVAPVPKKCPTCGTQVEENDLFCPECGCKM